MSAKLYKKFDNAELIILLKTCEPCFAPRWSKYLFYVGKGVVKNKAKKEKIEYTLGKTGGNKDIIILNN